MIRPLRAVLDTGHRGSSGALRPGPSPPASRAIQLALGLVWLLDGALQFQPFMYTNGFFTQVIDPVIQGQPGPIAHSMAWEATLVQPHWALFNTLFALIQVLIGLGLLVPTTVRPALAASFGWALGVWWFGEGFGQLLTGSASPLSGAPGAVILYALIGALVWPADRSGGRSAAARGPFGQSGGKVAWAVLWLGMAALWLLPANRAASSVHDALKSAASSFPALAGAMNAAAGAAAGRGGSIAIALAVVSVAVGLGAFSRYLPFFLTVGTALSLAYWVLGEGLGGIPSGTATDPNAGLLFVLLAAALFPWERHHSARATQHEWSTGQGRTPAGAAGSAAWSGQ